MNSRRGWGGGKVASRRKWLVLIFVIALISVTATAIYRFNHPSFAEVARFNSPDRRWGCVVYECPPPGMMFSPHRYRFEIRDGQGRLVGEGMEMANDSSALEFSRAEWTYGGVVLQCAPGQAIVCRIGDSSTEWEYHPQYAAP